MRTMSSRYFLNRLMERGVVDTGEIDRIVQALGKFYGATPTTARIEEWGRVDHLKISTDENFRQTEGFVGTALSRAAFETIRFYTDEFYRREEALFESRVSGRWIRDGHGDLRMEHVHLAPKMLNIFDCVEFNDRLRYVDVANDLAFLVMEFDLAGRSDLGRYFASRMAGVLGDTAMPRLLDFYKCYRAYVRGKVAAIQSAADTTPTKERPTRLAGARLNYRQSLRYAVAGSDPLVLAVVGRAGSGKSAMSRALGGELGWPVFSSDQTRKEIAGRPLFERVDAASRATLYSNEMTCQTYDKLLNGAANLAGQGKSVILDATFGRRAQREQLRAKMGELGFALRIVEAQADDETVRRRLRERDTRRDEVSDARLKDFEVLARAYEPPSIPEGTGLCVVSTAGSPEETVAATLRLLTRSRFGSGER
jgi:predicted kinase